MCWNGVGIFFGWTFRVEMVAAAFGEMISFATVAIFSKDLTWLL